MSQRYDVVLARLAALGSELDARGALLSGEAAAHAHLASLTQARPGISPRHQVLGPRRYDAVLPAGSAGDLPAPAVRDASPVAEVVAARPDIFGTRIALWDGTLVPVLTREAVVAQLLAAGGLAIGLAGVLLRYASGPGVDPDEVREILKAARQGDRFQPMLELLDLAQ